MKPRNSFFLIGIGELLKRLNPQIMDGVAKVSCQFEDGGDLHIVDIETIFVREIEARAVEDKLGQTFRRVK